MGFSSSCVVVVRSLLGAQETANSRARVTQGFFQLLETNGKCSQVIGKRYVPLSRPGYLIQHGTAQKLGNASRSLLETYGFDQLIFFVGQSKRQETSSAVIKGHFFTGDS
jgi:hypothetical protein